MTEISSLLVAATEQESENRLKIEEVKEWLAEYTKLHEEDVARFPTHQETSHWNLIAADFDRSKDALFLLASFQSESVSFVAGRGNFDDVRGFGENFQPTNGEDVLVEAARRFRCSWTIVLPLVKVKRWYES